MDFVHPMNNYVVWILYDNQNIVNLSPHISQSIERAFQERKCVWIKTILEENPRIFIINFDEGKLYSNLITKALFILREEFYHID